MAHYEYKIQGLPIGSRDFDTYFTRSLGNQTEFNFLADKAIDFLNGANPQLTPESLAKILPSYSAFYPVPDSPRLWSTIPDLLQMSFNYGEGVKVALKLSGVAAGGKDALVKTIHEKYPEFMHKLVTATTRAKRKDEIEGEDYFFMNVEDFLADVEANKFLEHVPQGDRLYGLPKKSIVNALTKGKRVLAAVVEMSAWKKIDAFFLENQNSFGNIPTESVFVMPHMSWISYAYNWLPSRRPNDTQNRRRRAALELHHAAFAANFILTNDFDPSGEALKQEAEIIHDHTSRLLVPEVQQETIP